MRQLNLNCSLRSCRLCCKYKSAENTLAYYSKVEITKIYFISLVLLQMKQLNINCSLRPCPLCCKYKSAENTLAYYSKVEITKIYFISLVLLQMKQLNLSWMRFLMKQNIKMLHLVTFSLGTENDSMSLTILEVCLCVGTLSLTTFNICLSVGTLFPTFFVCLSVGTLS